MKRVVSVLLALVLVLATAQFVCAEENSMQYDKKTAEIRIRDPYILLEDGLYYMYGTGAATGRGYGCYVSPDLENWAGPYNVFTADNSFIGVADFWAPECHKYGDKFYLFATFRSRTTEHRGVGIFRADSPMGSFTLISDGAATPHDSDSIDGTLYVENGVPYMVYVQEWTTTDDGIGRMAVAQLSDDLTRFVTEPKEIFRADTPRWADGEKVTDGPFVYRTKTGKLVMLWSNLSKQSYCVGMATADSVTGEWTQCYSRLFRRGAGFKENGGHGMLFTDKNGQLTLCMHSPNGTREDGTFETATFLPVRDMGYTLALQDSRLSIVERILCLFDGVRAVFTKLFR